VTSRKAFLNQNYIERAAGIKAALFISVFILGQIVFGVNLESTPEAKFLFQQTQDLFESSMSDLISNPRSSDKLIEKCLELEPDNFQCLYMRFFINKRLNRQQASPIEEVKFLLWKKKIFDQERDQEALLLISSFESKVESKNYSLARQILEKLGTEFPDYPDLIIMKRNLNYLSAEQPTNSDNVVFNLNKAFEIYQKRCRTIDTMTIRKYLFDIDLCNRKELNDAY